MHCSAAAAAGFDQTTLNGQKTTLSSSSSSTTTCSCWVSIIHEKMSDFVIPEIALPRILCRLPIKSLLRCTAVSKKWNSIITSSSFISAQLHFTATSNHHHLLLLRRYFKTDPHEHYSLHLDDDVHGHLPLYQTLPCPFEPTSKFYFRIVGSVNGLLLLWDDLFGHSDVIFLWNPIINKHLQLPKPISRAQEIGCSMFVLGFGFDSSTNDHKVVRITYVQSYHTWFNVTPPLAEVFSLKRGTWKSIDATGVDLSVAQKSWSQCFLSGSIHWIAYKRREVQGFDLWILLFHVKKEVFKKMKLPKLLQNCPEQVAVSGFWGSLSVTEYFTGQVTSKFCNIWVKTRYGDKSSWTKMFCVHLDEGIGMVLNLRENDEVLLATQEGDLVSYDPASRETKDLGVHGDLDAFFAGSYTESLVLLDKKRDDNAEGNTEADGISDKVIKRLFNQLDMLTTLYN